MLQIPKYFLLIIPIASFTVLEIRKSLSAIMWSFFPNKNILKIKEHHVEHLFCVFGLTLKNFCRMVYSNKFSSLFKFILPVYLSYYINAHTHSHITIDIHKRYTFLQCFCGRSSLMKLIYIKRYLFHINQRCSSNILKEPHL